MNFGFLIILAVVVVVVAVVLPVVLKLIGGGKPAAAANLPYRKKDRGQETEFRSQESATRKYCASLRLFAAIKSVNICVHPWLKTSATNSARYWSSNSTMRPTKKKPAVTATPLLTPC